jgi:hypothetical protein
MANLFKHFQQYLAKFIANSFRPEEVEVTIRKVGNRSVYSYSKVVPK